MHPPAFLLTRYYHDDFPPNDDPTATAILCTIFTVLSTVFLEIILAGLSAPASDATQPGPTSKTRDGQASPALRAKRLAVACAIYPVILTLFTVRLVDGTGPWEMYPVAIVPFVCATFALFRTVVDCVLVRFNTGLTAKLGSKGVLWLPLMPFSLVVVGLPAYDEAVGVGLKRSEIERRAEGDLV